MTGYKFKALRQSNDWISPAFIAVDNKGLITSIGSAPQEGVNYEEVNGYALPSFFNAHSHAFQYGMAGLAEIHPASQTSNDFWSWREKMYEIALTVDPDDMEAIATMLYAEMVRHGYSHVAEFHYLHHDKNGKPYENIAEMADRLIAAAKNAGINITIVPMLYQNGGFNKPPEEHQRRFISTTDEYLKIIEHLKKSCQDDTHANLGYGAHSLRAVDKENITRIIDSVGDKLPFHIHISEQLKEVAESEKELGKRPVAWLLDNFDVNRNFNLVHATHLTTEEIIGIARANANVVLCPSTEGNLGDGIFPLSQFYENNGRWCIGTDSHIGLNPFEELRILDYGQRLISHKRNPFAPKGGDSADYALQQAIINGKSACGIGNSAFFEIGQPMDAMVIDGYHPLLSDTQYLLSTMVYHFDASNVYGTLINGKWVVKGGFHSNQLSIRSSFSKTMEKLKIRSR